MAACLETGAGSGGGSLLATLSSRWGGQYGKWRRELARSAAVSVAAQKTGGDSTQPMGSAKGRATIGGSPGSRGMITASRGACSALTRIR